MNWNYLKLENEMPRKTQTLEPFTIRNAVLGLDSGFIASYR
jgi:hypothetical protein